MVQADLRHVILAHLFIYLYYVLEGNTFSSNSHSTKWPSIKDV